jgi:hypothetical protein
MVSLSAISALERPAASWSTISRSRRVRVAISSSDGEEAVAALDAQCGG